jgi:glucosylceramidase
MKIQITLFLATCLLFACNKPESKKMDVKIFQTSSKGEHFKEIILDSITTESFDTLELFPDQEYQTITGFGGAFTQSSAYLLSQLSEANQKDIIDSYFSEKGANYTLCRTHINSCDFSTENYAYDTIPNDTLLENFSIARDLVEVVPMIKKAQEVSKEGFNIVASPWTAPPWMKDNKDWKGGKLLPKYYDSWALYFSKYITEYKKLGIPIWGLTVENEPLGNDANWESMHYTPEEMAEFVKNHLGPQLEKDSLNPNVLVYDQNRGKELEDWADKLLTDQELSKYIYGTAVHWYTSTVDWYPQSLNYTHELAPDKHIIHTEGCIDAEVPHWNDDAWYWKKEATDWGWDWAPDEDKKDHPKYSPVYRYARDIIGCLNSWVEGWIDWNMVLDQNGGPNWAKNWCIAPIIVDVEKDEVYKTPLFYTMQHFSKYIRPNAIRIGFELSNKNLMATAVKNTDGSIVIVILNTSQKNKNIQINLLGQNRIVSIAPEAIQTIII